MQVGDLVVFRSDTVPGIIVLERPANQQTKVPRIGVLWIDCNDVSWEPAEYLKVISEKQ
jgi:hypothetical protein